MKPAPRLLEAASLDDFFLYRISRLLGTAGALVVRLCEGEYGVTRREWRLLELLMRHEALPPSGLAELAQLDRARTSRAISSLVEKRLVVRLTCASDRRQAELRLTPAGLNLCAALLPRARAINLELLQALSPQDVATLENILDRLQDRAVDLVEQHQDFPRANRRAGRQGRVQVPRS